MSASAASMPVKALTLLALALLLGQMLPLQLALAFQFALLPRFFRSAPPCPVPVRVAVSVGRVKCPRIGSRG